MIRLIHLSPLVDISSMLESFLRFAGAAALLKMCSFQEWQCRHNWQRFLVGLALDHNVSSDHCLHIPSYCLYEMKQSCTVMSHVCFKRYSMKQCKCLHIAVSWYTGNEALDNLLHLLAHCLRIIVFDIFSITYKWLPLLILPTEISMQSKNAKIQYKNIPAT